MTTHVERFSAAELNLNTNVLAFAGQLAAEGRYAVLLGMGVRQDQIPRLSNLSFADIAMMGASVLSAALIHARIDADVLDIVFRNLDRTQREMEGIRRLIGAGASQCLMHELTGMDGDRYAQFRRVLGLHGSGGGRPRELLRGEATAAEVAEAERIWTLWQASSDREEVERWLWVHDQTGHSLRLIERVLRNPDWQGVATAAGRRRNGEVADG